MIPDIPQEGILHHWKAVWFGDRAARLTENSIGAHFLSYLLIISQSIAVVLVFGHADVPLILGGSWAIRILAGMVLFVLVITVIAADMSLLASLRRIPALARNRQHWQMYEHLAYVFFVLLVEGSTYAVVLAATDSDPQALVRSAPIIPTVGFLFVLLVVLRVLLICWSAVQLIIVKAKLPVLLSTLINTGKEIMGAHVERQLADLNIGDLEVTDTFRVYAEMARPPRSIPSFWHPWRVKHELAQEAEEERQANNVISALKEIKRQRSTEPKDEPPSPPHGGIPAPAPQAPDMGLNPLASEEVRTIVQSMPEMAVTSSRLYVVKNAPKGRRRNAPGRRTAKGKRDTTSVEGPARVAWQPGMTVAQLQGAAGISRGAASKWLKIIEAEHSGSATA